MTENTEQPLSNPSKVYALFYAFFLIPLMITIFGVLFFFLFKMLTYEKQDPYHLLNNISSGSLTKRWQSAYELSNLMTDYDKIPQDDYFISQMINMYKKSVHDDTRVRTYLALAMGQTENIKFCDDLIMGLNDKDLENKVAAIKSVGMIGCQESIELLKEFSKSELDNQIRLASVISLGILKDKSSIDVLVKLLDDEEANIRWDAAISLAKIGDNSGYLILNNLIDRKYYDSFDQVDENEVNNAILTVLALISDKSNQIFEKNIRKLAKSDKNLKIREFAMKIVGEYY